MVPGHSLHGLGLFAYLPILVGYNAAREFGGSAALGGIAGMMCIANSAMPLLAPGAADPATAILLPLTNAQYNPAAGGMIAALIAGAFFAWMERQIRKVMPTHSTRSCPRCWCSSSAPLL